MAFPASSRRIPRPASRSRRTPWLAAVLLTIGAAPVSAPADVATLEALRAADLRLGAIGYRLATANAALCTEQAPVPGLVVHAVDQYAGSEQPAARAAFGFATGVAVEGVVPGSPAARAGLRADDSIVSVNGQPVPVCLLYTSDAADE